MLSWAVWSLMLISVIATNIKIEPIVKTNLKPETITLNASYQAVLIYKELNELLTKRPFRIKTSSAKAEPEFPILVVVEQIKQVTAWSIPLVVETDIGNELSVFRNVSKTLCHDAMTLTINGSESIIVHPAHQTFIINLSTASAENVDVTVELEEENDFYVQLGTNYNLTISPSEPRYVYFKFDNNTVDTVVIQISSEDTICLTVSVQDNKCPVFDMEKDIKYEGIYQTMNTKGAITIRKRNYPEGFFLVFVAKTDNFDCSQESSYIPWQSRLANLHKADVLMTSKVNFVVKNSIAVWEYSMAMVWTLVIVLSAMILLFTFACVLNRYGTISSCKVDDVIITDYYEKLSEDKIAALLKMDDLSVSQFSRHPTRINKRSFNYTYHTLSIALFYSIPVVQLVVIYQRIVNQTGNEDMCYYNFLCAHPAGPFSDFNHIFSNVGYLLFGVLLIAVADIRRRKIKLRKDKGIPVHNGLHFAMGTALVIEGLLSACYHVCPSQSNYQFDTSFMYVMAVLCMIKLYQSRHSEINATAYTAFTILGAAIFMAMVGILNGNLAIWVIFVVCYTVLVIVVSFKIYFMNYVLEGLALVRHGLRTKGFCKESFIPIRKLKFGVLVLANILNYSILIVGLVLYSTNVTDFATFLLGLLMANALIHCLFYTFMKLYVKEKICMEAILYGVLGLTCWAASGVFFLDAAVLWTVTPAESRQWNQECIVAKFYDKHDIWHLLSAPALYFTFMYLIHLDDDILNKPQSELPVF